MSDHHPCWPEYLEQTATLPVGAAPGFEQWLAGVTVAGARFGPTRPFLCDAATPLPERWVRGDPTTADDVDPGQLRLARDPSRHLAVRVITDVPTVRAALVAGGWEPVTPPAHTDTADRWFVIDRHTAARHRSTRPAHRNAAGRGVA